MRASIIILTYNQLDYCTRPCIESVLRNTPDGEYELIIVDNASSDGTAEYLTTLSRESSLIRVHLNSTNKGYAGGNNDGMRIAKGNCIILLNNDTLVLKGWLDRLLRPIEQDTAMGLIGPVTNSAGNEQHILIPALNENNWEQLAGQYTERHENVLFKTEKLGFFCVAMRKDTFEKVGFLDERFGIGMFEDDDFCVRVKREGYYLAITEGCFVYHKGSASFKLLGHQKYLDLFNENKKLFFKKHNIPWTLTDIAQNYWQKINTDLSIAISDPDLSQAALDRISVRTEHFRHLLMQILQQERSLEGYSPDNEHLRRVLILEAFENELLKGSWKQRYRFLWKTMGALYYRSVRFSPFLTSLPNRIRRFIGCTNSGI